MAKSKRIRDLNTNEKMRVKLALQHVKFGNAENLKDLKWNSYNGDQAYQLTSEPMFGFRDIGRDKKISPLLFPLQGDKHIGRFQETEICDKIDEAEAKGVPYELLLLSDVKDNEIDIFKTYQDLVAHVTSPDFKI